MRPFRTERPTVADLLACKGKRPLTQLFVRSVEEAAAAELAGIDMVNLIDSEWSARYREAMPRTFVTVGLAYGMYATAEEYIRAAFAAMRIGADAVYCAGSVEIIARMYAEGIPVCGHVGLIPTRCTWTGGYKAVGRTAASALKVWSDVQRLEAAGAFAVEMEVVPDRVATAISRRTSMLVVSLGGGPGCDAQYLFAEDVLGTNTGHYPRHSKRYRDLNTELQRLQGERIAAFQEFGRDVATGAYPGPEHCVRVPDVELTAFLSKLPPVERSADERE
jgi:3-methyl-2-oxobutanoate hydroxymethyltransferase